MLPQLHDTRCVMQIVVCGRKGRMILVNNAGKECWRCRSEAKSKCYNRCNWRSSQLMVTVVLYIVHSVVHLSRTERVWRAWCLLCCLGELGKPYGGVTTRSALPDLCN